MSYDLNDVTKSVIDILRKIQPFSDVLYEEHLDNPLTGTEMDFQDYEMVYIVLELMDLYNISFDRNDFEDYKFNSIRKISETVYNKLNM